jgi:hypothetical protein
MNSGGPETDKPQLHGDRGLTTIRQMNQKQFEAMFNNIVGFEDAYLCWSDHHVWGANQNHGSKVLEAFINLDAVQHSYAIDRNQQKPRIVINQEFIDRIIWLIRVFFNYEDSIEQMNFTEHSTLSKDFEGRSDFNWVIPEVVVVYCQFTLDGESQTLPVMENAHDSVDDEVDVEFDSPDEYFEYLSQRYSTFLEEYKQSFDENGNIRA